MGDAADSSNFAMSGFDNELWEKINSYQLNMNCFLKTKKKIKCLLGSFSLFKNSKKKSTIYI